MKDPGDRWNGPGAWRTTYLGGALVGQRTCVIEDCERPHGARGWCGPHYKRWMRTGDPLGSLRPSLEERLWPRLDKESASPCWIWTGCHNNHGYGQIAVNGQMRYVHRIVYELLVGPIPAGLSLDHLCRTPPCANPEHLEPVTHRENQLRGNTFAAAGAIRTHCKNGHEFTPENTRMRSRNRRACMRCDRDHARQSRLRKLNPPPIEGD